MKSVAMVLSLLFGLACAAQAPAASTNFFKGKTLTIIVPFSPGGGYDTWARLLGPGLKKKLGLSEIRVENMPGGGGLVGTNAIYHAKGDGLTIGDTDAAGTVLSQIDNAPGIRFDARKFDWVGRPDNNPHIIAVHADSPYKSFDDLADLKGGDTVIKPLATGKGSSDYNTAVLTYNAFDIPYHIIAAFKGSHEEKATFIAGEGTTISVSASDVAALGDVARVVAITSAEPFDKLPGVPTVLAVGKRHNLPAANLEALRLMGGIMSLGHAFIAPPGVPPQRLTALRSAFKSVVQSSDFRERALKSRLYLGYESGEALASKAKDALDHASKLAPFLKAQ